MDQNGQTEKQLEKQATAKAGATAAHVAASYYTGGAYEQVRNIPVVGNVAKSAEEKIGETIAKAPGSKRLGKAAKALDDAGAIDAIDSAAGLIGGSAEGAAGASNNAKDVEALNNRGKNQGEFSPTFSRRRDTDEDGEVTTKRKTKSTPDLGEEEGLGSKEKDGLQDKKSKTNVNGTGTGDAQGSVSGASPFAKLKSNWTKIKIIAIGVGAAVALFLVAFFIMLLASAGEILLNSLSSYFGLPEADTKENMSVDEADGLLTNENFYGDQNGSYSIEELVVELKKDNSCNATLWNSIGDWFDGWDGKYDNLCAYLRFVENYITELENANSGVTLDRSLIISTIFYGYGSQPGYSDYANPESTEDIIYAHDHYQTLVDLLEDGKLTKNDLKNIINHTLANTSYTYYQWKVEDVKDSDGDVTESIGKCVAKTTTKKAYSLKKWQIFMRFGESAASIWEKDQISQSGISSSDEECTGEVSDSDLIKRIKTAGGSDNATIDDSVRTAQEAFDGVKTSSISLFDQKASTEGTSKDIFQSYSSSTGTVVFDYKNGFAYNKFPGYKQAFEDPSIDLEYDDAITPKVIESTIENIVGKKTYMNEILAFEDQDDPYKYLGSYDGYSSVILGAYCGDALTAPLDQISVYVTDCDGKHLETVSMKEYITGVAYREVSDKEDDYVKAEMLAAITFSLHRRNNYSKGTTIRMRSGNCDQAYCPMDRGCHSSTSSIVCGYNDGVPFNCTSYIPGSGSGTNTSASNQERITRYESYYDEVSNFLIIDKSTGKVAGIEYKSWRQNEWYQKAAAGMNFTQIIQESYADNPNFQLVRCSSYGDSDITTISTSTEQYGNGETTEYPNVAPSKGKFYGFSYSNVDGGKGINVNPVWEENNIKTVSTNCEAGNWNNTYKVNIEAEDNFKTAFANVCKILTDGVKLSDGTTCKYTASDLQGGETYSPRKTLSGAISDISYGITQDWNYNRKITVNGKTYQPYGSSRNLEEYNAFVSAIGKEESCENINYILYKYAYEDAGFEWGGNWGKDGNSGTYNGMHFQVKY